MEPNVTSSGSAEPDPIIPLSPELIDSALTAWDDLYLSLTSQNKLGFDEVGLALIGATLRSLKEAYPYSFDAKPARTKSPTRTRTKEKPSDAKRPQE